MQPSKRISLVRVDGRRMRAHRTELSGSERLKSRVVRLELWKPELLRLSKGGGLSFQGREGCAVETERNERSRPEGLYH